MSYLPDLDRQERYVFEMTTSTKVLGLYCNAKLGIVRVDFFFFFFLKRSVFLFLALFTGNLASYITLTTSCMGYIPPALDGGYSKVLDITWVV